MPVSKRRPKKEPKRKARATGRIPRDSPLYKIAQATGENEYDLQAAIAALMAEGWTFDECWELMRDAVNDGRKIVDVFAEKLATKEPQ